MLFYNNIDPVLLEIGPLSIRWYALFFALGLFSAYLISARIFKREGLSLEKLDSLAIYLAIGLVVGARIGHVLFYNLEYFSSQPLDVFKIWQGGLSSHGAALGVLAAYSLYIFIKKEKFSLYADLLVVCMPVVAGFVRIGNFFNSEIIGKPTDGEFGVVFQKLSEDFPRHPTQLYEALIAFMIFPILLAVYLKAYKKMPKYFILFLFALLYFTTRFFVEIFKERHIVPDSFPLSMGQILSILPVILAVAYFAAIVLKKNQKRKISSVARK